MITTDTANATLTVEDLGVTLRTLLACAAQGYKSNPKRVWKVLYTNGVVIGSVRLRTDIVKKENLNDQSSDNARVASDTYKPISAQPDQAAVREG